MSRRTRDDNDLLLGEWACLGSIVHKPTHGFALSHLLAPSGDIGRIWSLSRPLTYRAVDQLLARQFIEARTEEQGIAGGSRTILAATRSGKSAFRTWVTTPVPHLRALRSELLLKIVLAQRCGLSTETLLIEQERLVKHIRSGLSEQLRATPDDLVLRWRLRSAEGASKFLDDLHE